MNTITQYRNTDMLPDALLKDYFSDSRHFSDIINGIVFDGKQVILEDMVGDYDTSTSTYFDASQPFTIERNRDTIKKVTVGQCVGLIAIENQSQERLNMAYRAIEYDCLNRLRQFHQIQNMKDYVMHPPLQVMTLVIYYGERRWKGPRTYEEMTKSPPEEFKEFMGYKMFPITDVIDLDYQKFHNVDNQNLIKGLIMLYQWKGDYEVFKDMTMNRRVALIIAAFADDIELLKMIKDEEEEEVNMCESIRLFKEKNILEGKRIGEEQGKRIGEERGKKLGVMKALMGQLNRKLGKLTPEIIIQIEKSSTEQLDELTIKIFDIEKEEDVLAILQKGNTTSIQ